ncbi:hypothetical protein BpHYR1_001323 [Brachionus plicatilis]|uniref:Uncharacterized protein n=1 Tax=Brachionus plicatilis TaxID=10195 RepID=A0A3M7T7T7_BRAPC|nr:hypothetical protein BpHYR1_001323 [Brachionus plicatilis]
MIIAFFHENNPFASIECFPPCKVNAQKHMHSYDKMSITIFFKNKQINNCSLFLEKILKKKMSQKHFCR